MSDTVFVLGAGRAGRGLARALRASGVRLCGLHGRRAANAPDQVTAGPLPDSVRDASVVLVAVRDDQLDAALRQLAASGLRSETVVLHLSGSADPPVFAEMRRMGIACGTFHPLLPLAEPSRAPTLFGDAWIGIDGDPRAREAATRLASRLGARTLDIPAGARSLYHAAAVMASNLTVILATEAERIMRAAGVKAQDARGAVAALFAAAAANVAAEGAAALTGPLARGEIDTIRRHLRALRPYPASLRAYVAVSLAALPEDTPQSAALRLMLEEEASATA